MNNCILPYIFMNLNKCSKHTNNMHMHVHKKSSRCHWLENNVILLQLILVSLVITMPWCLEIFTLSTKRCLFRATSSGEKTIVLLLAAGGQGIQSQLKGNTLLKVFVLIWYCAGLFAYRCINVNGTYYDDVAVPRFCTRDICPSVPAARCPVPRILPAFTRRRCEGSSWKGSQQSVTHISRYNWFNHFFQG